MNRRDRWRELGILAEALMTSKPPVYTTTDYRPISLTGQSTTRTTNGAGHE